MNIEDRRTLFLGSHFPWWEWDVIKNHVDFSDLKATMLGYEPNLFHGDGYEAFTNLLHPEDFDKTMDAMRLVLQEKTDLYNIDYRILAKDGSYHWYMDRGIVIDRDRHGVIQKLRGIVIDLKSEISQEKSQEVLIQLLNKTINNNGSTTNSMLTLCSNCQRAKADNFEWIPISKDLEDLLGETISHGICPDCIRRLYPEMADSILRKLAKI
jgi:hypothetical protein